MNEQDIVNSFVELYNKNVEAAEKFDTLRYQYGIASRKIHELKGTNALLRERVTELETKLAEYELQPEPIDFSRVPRIYSEPEQEQAALGLTLRSTRARYGIAGNDTFLIKYTTNPNAVVPINRELSQWWCLDADGQPDAWDDWKSWLSSYGPFVEELND